MTSVNIPLISLDTNDNDIISSSNPKHNLVLLSRSIVHALKTSGFLLITSPHVPIALQQDVVQATREIFLDQNSDKTLIYTQDPSSSSPLSGNDSSSSINNNNRSAIKIVTHPTDPKQYIMLESPPPPILKNNDNNSNSNSSGGIIFTPFQQQTLQTYWNALEHVKRQLLTCIAIGLELPDSQFFVRLHQKNQSALRLLSYPPLPLPPKELEDKEDWLEPKNDKPAPGQTPPQRKPPPPPLPNVIIRCKPHSDYGSITLLLTDGVPGLQALIDDTWTMVPHVPGAVVVNIGSLLSDWTNGELVATLHRVIVVEPSSSSSSSSSSSQKEAPELLLENNSKEEEEEEENASAVAQPVEITMTVRTPTLTTNTTTRNRTRISLAFFADPDPDVAVQLKLQKDIRINNKTDINGTDVQEEKNKDCLPTIITTTSLSVADYIQWRSGGGTKDVQRSGIAYSTEHEEARAKRGNDEHNEK
jgi:isopenicillin N synthase-like dioxygenase